MGSLFGGLKNISNLLVQKKDKAVREYNSENSEEVQMLWLDFVEQFCNSGHVVKVITITFFFK